jgi:hypothetical protein
MRIRALLVSALLMGCSAGDGDKTSVGPLGGKDASADGDFNLDGGSLDPDGFTSPDDSGSTCASKSFAAAASIAPIDIIWVVDSSGSMDNEAKRVQDNLNVFSDAMGKIGLDYHVVMITSSSFVKVPPPLGTSPNYKFIDRSVNSNEPLQVLLDEYATYSSFLRPLAVTHFVAVTDDESEPLTAPDFYSKMSAKLGHGFKFHAIASEKVAPTFTNPEGACQTSGFPPEGAAAPGIQYYKLADATGGLKFSICTADWSGLFTSLTKAVAVAAKLPCTFTLPLPEMGTIDPSKVNVNYTKGSGGTVTLVYVANKEACTAAGGWYYDDPAKPTHAILCPSTCTTVSADKTGKIDIALGCATKIK